MAEHNKLGKRGEEIAIEFLIEKGYSILEHNWRSGKDEIDIIAVFENFLIIAEVKTRSTDYFGDPAEAVSDKKQSFLIRAADDYVNKNEIDLDIRYDIISIILKANNPIIHHIEDAFYPEIQE